MSRRGPRGPLAVLQRRGIRAQLAITLALVPAFGALAAAWIAPIVVDVALGDASLRVRDAAVDAVRIALLVALAAVSFATATALVLLGASMRAAVDELQAATESIASGNFAHRVCSIRRDELGMLAASIDSMAERLQRLEQARRRVLACVSHELRTPLTIVQGHAFTLARSEIDAHRRGRLELIQNESMRLAGLVSELVDASCIHAGGIRLHPARADLVDVVREHVVRHADAAAERGVTIELLGRAHRVRADLDVVRIGQVLDNLLANAVRHAAGDRRVAVRVDASRAGEPIVEVANACEPLDPALVQSIFEPFTQGHARTGSVGLGLAIAHGIVAAHGGSLAIDACAARAGTARFAMRLPAPTRGRTTDNARRAGSAADLRTAAAGAEG